MTATDELREGLRKRGESWHKWPDDYSTTWQAYSNPHTATESMDGTLIVTGLTPEQAIAATLGRGTCHNEGDQKDFLCSECGARTFIDTGETYTMIDSLENIIEQPTFCPNCGARVVEVDE